ncbi:DUF2927 domain-containing protein [Algoriphagus halophilus]|uniref:DUF2927 domain-containing protein n=1 Tax=Algoriphagus halophilus TaxID=226505 RepID=UPI00358F650D
MKSLIKFLIIAILFSSCINEEVPDLPTCENFDSSILDSDQTDFFDIVFGSEFGNGVDRIRKWNTDVKIYVPSGADQDLINELEVVIEELNSYSESFFLRV